ncbi:MAG: 5-(carboxyamino)imidazole ribonucleotide synthase [Thermoleophilia bacterium]|nr:5-(carboxyamino)imidazole ribonucleotide synthase [Thermoleophilia bacterium]
MRLAILGGGQLAWMLALAAESLGVSVAVLDPSPEAGAGRVADHVVAAYDDLVGLDEVSAGADVVTYEFENVPAAAVTRLVEHGVPVLPSPRSLAVTQDRLSEKQLLAELGIPVAPHAAVDGPTDVETALAQVGAPGILKTRRLGYDGKGQVRVRSADELAPAVAELGGSGLIYEGFVEFSRELSVVIARGADGSTAVYTPVENEHRDGILALTIAPAPQMSTNLAESAQAAAIAVAEALDHVGVLCVELFETADGIVANEIAPRVHNSGHWSIEGAVTSQFENHVRAVVGMPLGDASVRGVSAMVNLVGGVPPVAQLEAIAGATVHLYGKEPRRARKLGHVTIVAESAELLAVPLGQVRALADAAWDA